MPVLPTMEIGSRHAMHYSILFATETTPMIVGALPTRAAQAPPSGLLTQASGACRARSCAQLHLQPPASYEKGIDNAALAKQNRLARALGIVNMHLHMALEHPVCRLDRIKGTAHHNDDQELHQKTLAQETPFLPSLCPSSIL